MKHQLGLSLLIIIMLLAATRVAIEIEDTVAYVLCAVAAGMSGAWFLMDPSAPAASQLLAISLHTLYQSHFVIEEMEADWWLRWFMFSMVLIVYLVDYFIWRRHATGTLDGFMDNDALKKYTLIANLLLAMMGYFPLYGAGMFRINKSMLIAVLAALQFALGATESLRRRSLPVTMPCTHVALKCLPIMYLPPAMWTAFGLFVAINVSALVRMRRSADENVDTEKDEGA
jgi:hypothetical protein